MAGGHEDLTPTVQFGLGNYYALVTLANLGYGLFTQLKLKKVPQALLWYAVAAFFAIFSLLYYAKVGPGLPTWYKDLWDQGIERSLMDVGITGGTASSISWAAFILMLVVILGCAADVFYSYVLKRLSPPANGNGNNGRSQPSPLPRIVAELLIITGLSLFLYGLNAITYFVASIVGLMAFLVWRKTFTQPAVAWGILNLGLLFGGLSISDGDFRANITKPDNVPIVGLVFVLGFFTWLAFRKAVINDERIAEGRPPAEKEDDDKVLVWPDLVYTELICMVVITIILVVWAVSLPAPLEQPASGTKTPNPSKAPWYFLGLQEMLVYYDPWIAGVVLPTMIIIGLIALPYIDFNQKGSGYFTFAERPFAIINFLFGFIILWFGMIFLMTIMRGPNQNFFGLYEYWDPHKVVPMNNVSLSDYFWVRGLGKIWATTDPSSLSGILTILIRESPGIILVLGYFLLLPPILARTVFRGFYIRMGFIRYMTLITLIQFMASLPIKMVLRWTINLKYIVAIPEYFFNI
jgi:hypothetical protein